MAVAILLLIISAIIVFIGMIANVSADDGYGSRWYAGAYYSGEPTQSHSIHSQITVPNSDPRPDEFYYLLTSIDDNAGSYDQIGLVANYGVWGLDYSWTTGDCANRTFHFDPKAMILQKGATYDLYMTSNNDGKGFFFEVYQAGQSTSEAPLWSQFVDNNSTAFEVTGTSLLHCGYRAYTDYEEVWSTHYPNGYPNFNFTFAKNEYYIEGRGWVPTKWEPYNITSTIPVPPEVHVEIKGNQVYVYQPYLASTPEMPVGILWSMVFVGLMAIVIFARRFRFLSK